MAIGEQCATLNEDAKLWCEKERQMETRFYDNVAFAKRGIMSVIR